MVATIPPYADFFLKASQFALEPRDRHGGIFAFGFLEWRDFQVLRQGPVPAALLGLLRHHLLLLVGRRLTTSSSM